MSNYHFHSNSVRIALAGILSAGSMVLLWMACLSPTGRLGLNAAAGLFPVAGVLMSGRAAGYCCWIVTGLLGLVLLPDKGMALLYLMFFGLYPVLKSVFETRKSLVFCWSLKLIYFNMVLTVSVFVLGELFFSALPALLHRPLPAWVAGNIVFIAYDIGLSRLIFGFFCRIGLDGSKRK